jgi:NAD-dependent dihydropyrimidine dehydrogenase PreA subunit
MTLARMAEGLLEMKALRSFWEHARATLFYTVALDQEICSGCETCYEVCPVGCFSQSEDGAKIELSHLELCVACGACQLQCPMRAARLLPKRA